MCQPNCSLKETYLIFCWVLVTIQFWVKTFCVSNLINQDSLTTKITAWMKKTILQKIKNIFSSFFMLYWKLLNVIALGQTKSDNINWLFKLTMTFTVIYYNNEHIGPMKSDHIKWIITLSLITVSGFHYIPLFFSNKKNSTCKTQKFLHLIFLEKWHLSCFHIRPNGQSLTINNAGWIKHKKYILFANLTRTNLIRLQYNSQTCVNHNLQTTTTTSLNPRPS